MEVLLSATRTRWGGFVLEEVWSRRLRSYSARIHADLNGQAQYRSSLKVQRDSTLTQSESSHRHNQPDLSINHFIQHFERGSLLFIGGRVSLQLLLYRCMTRVVTISNIQYSIVTLVSTTEVQRNIKVNQRSCNHMNSTIDSNHWWIRRSIKLTWDNHSKNIKTLQ